nr:mucin-2-like [Bactrocera oleae]
MRNVIFRILLCALYAIGNNAIDDLLQGLSGPATGPSGSTCNNKGVCENQPDGAMFLDSGSNGYIVCQCECEISMPCPSGIVFNPEVNVCDWPLENTDSPGTSSTPTNIITQGTTTTPLSSSPSTPPSTTSEITTQGTSSTPLSSSPSTPSSTTSDITTQGATTTPSSSSPLTLPSTTSDITTESTSTTVSGPATGPSGTTCNNKGVCENQPDGAMFPDSRSNGYIVCQCECGIQRPCPSGLVFSSVHNVCDWPSSKMLRVITLAIFVLAAEGGNVQETRCIKEVQGRRLAHPTDCSKFVQCINTSFGRVQKCPSGLAFNAQEEVCDYPSRTGCSKERSYFLKTSCECDCSVCCRGCNSYTTPTPSTISPSTTLCATLAPSNPTTPKPTSNSNPSPSPTQALTPTSKPCDTSTPTQSSSQTPSNPTTPKPTSNPNPSPSPTQTLTPTSKPFDTSTPTQSSSQTPSNPTTPKPTSNPNPSSSPTQALTPTSKPFDTSTPTQSSSQTPSNPTTPKPTSNPNPSPSPTQALTLTSNSSSSTDVTFTIPAPTQKNPGCDPLCYNLKDGSTSILEGNCQKFVVCVGGKENIFSCSNNLLYNSVTGECDYPGNVNCPWPQTPPSGPSAGPSGTNCATGGRCVGQQDGTSFTSETDACSKDYIVCQCECEVQRTCPSLLMFNHKLGVCDWPTSFGC